MIEFSKEVKLSKEMNEICKRVLKKTKPKGRPTDLTDPVNSSVQFERSQLEWLKQKAHEQKRSVSFIIREMIEKQMQNK